MEKTSCFQGTVRMERTRKLPKSDLRRIFLFGFGFMVMAYLLVSIIDAAVEGGSVYRQVFSPGSGEIAVRLLFSSVLFLFIAYVADFLLKHRRLEEALVKYQAGMDASVDGIAILDSRHQCAYLNGSQARLYGYRSHAELIGKPWRLFYDDDEMRRFEEEIFPAVVAKGGWRGEAIGRRRDGSAFPQEISLTAIDRDSMVCIVRDITEQKNSEEELERKARQLSTANRELEAFGYSLTHDMRSYITRSSAAAQLLRKNYQASLDQNDRLFVKIICEANKDMEELIDDMLVLARINRREIRREMVDLGEMARRISADLLLVEPGRAVEFVISPGLVAAGDPHLLKVALENLLGNAWKYSSRVAAARIVFGMVEHGGGKAFFVRDNGMGFDMKDAGQLFKPFHRLQNAREFAGTGIGLATVQRVIQRHGGELWGEGEPGKGATFFFTLPA